MWLARFTGETPFGGDTRQIIDAINPEFHQILVMLDQCWFILLEHELDSGHCPGDLLLANLHRSANSVVWGSVNLTTPNNVWSAENQPSCLGASQSLTPTKDNGSSPEFAGERPETADRWDLRGCIDDNRHAEFLCLGNDILQWRRFG